MAYKKSTAVSPAMDRDWQCEDDMRTLSRAAEVIADNARLSNAMKMFRKQQKGTDKLVDMLSGSKYKEK